MMSSHSSRVSNLANCQPTMVDGVSGTSDQPSKSDTTAVAHAVTEDLAGNNMVARKNGIELLGECQTLAIKPLMTFTRANLPTR